MAINVAKPPLNKQQLLLIAQAHTRMNFCAHDDSRLCILMLYSCETARTRRQPFTASHPVSRDPSLSYTQAKAKVAADEKLKEDKRNKTTSDEENRMGTARSRTSVES
ncbi:hypothetical protein PV325_004204 [Microctonus aethiopoides]|nr:hypothetical protein PV325_004204 [Microctonus aethiopoides]